MNQLTIFDAIYPKYQITKPIRLIELFAGYGSQALALKYLGVPFEHWKICEWAVKSIQAYKDIHFTDQHLTFDKNRTKEEMVDYLYQKGISSNYNEPMSREQINRLNEEQLKTILENIAITHNLVNIQQVKGNDLEIVDTDKYEYIMTYSFPCQDLSLAGLGKGMSDTSTRSGLLWEVERILDECKELGTMPQILLMENVPQVHGEGAVDDFVKWQLKLESLGYKNYWQDLIATDYGIPQTRNRCFMISILGDYSYSFPPKQELKLKLKDMLEDNVDEKYYLSDAMIDYVTSRMPTGENKITTGISVGNRDSLTKAATLTTCSGNRATDNFIIENKDYDYSKEQGKIIEKMNLYEMGLKQYNRRTGVVIDTDGSSATLLARSQGDNNMILENPKNKKVNKHLRETLEQNTQEIKDGSYIDTYNRTIRNDDLSSTISTRVDAGNETYVALNDNKLLIKNATTKGYLEAEEGDGIDISTRMEYHRGTVQKGKTQTITTMGGENNGVVVDMKRQLCNELIKNNMVQENDVIRHSYSSSRMNDWENRSVEKNNLSPTLDTRCDCLGVVTLGNYSPSNHNASRIVDKNYSAPTVMENHGTITAITENDENVKFIKDTENYIEWEDGKNIQMNCRAWKDDKVIATLNTGGETKILKSNLRIRKLTPNECFRLMGVRDEDYIKCAKNQSNASLYHLAGDSIVVNVLMAIFKELL